MKTLLLYLLQMIIASGILYGYYHLVLRNKKFHQYNRFYLLGAMVIAILVPFLNIPVYFTNADKDSSLLLQTLTVISSSGADDAAIPIIYASKAPLESTNWLSWQNISYAFYILIALLILIRILFSLKKIRSIIRNNPVENLENIHFVNTTEPGTPFSFFRWLFWNRNIELQSEKGGQVFRHELFHIEQKHSRDIIFMELMTMVFWINPFFHLIKKEVKAIHEFLADKFAVKENRHWEYAELLLMQALGTQQHLVNPFFHNQIKRRIAMITSSKKPRYQYLSKLLVLPVAVLVVCLFAFTYKTKQDAATQQSLTENHVSDLTKREKTLTITDTIKPGNPGDIVYDKVDVQAYFPGGDLTWRRYLATNVDGSIAVRNKAPEGAYTVIVQFIVDIQGNISDIKALTSHGYGLEQEAIRGITKGPKWNPALKNGQKVKAYRVQPITFVVPYNNSKGKYQTLPDNKGVYDKVDIEASFPGGDLKWRRYLEVNLDASVAGKNKAPEGTYTTIIMFVVDIEGKISDVRPLTAHGYGMEQEAMKAIIKGPRWNPAVKDGRQVKAYRRQPITFVAHKGQKNVPSTSNATGNEPTQMVADNLIPDKVETEPSFPGGDAKWKQYIQHSVNAAVPLDSGANEGVYKVIVQFMVDKEGYLHDIKALTHHGFGMEEEAIRAIAKGPKWIPAVRDGQQVSAYKKQDITFAITDEDAPVTSPLTKTQKAGSTPENYISTMPAISVADLKKATVYKLLQFEEGTEIVSFLFTIDLPNDDIVQTYNTGDHFSTETKFQINNAMPGRIVTIDNITIMKNGKEMKVPSKVYRIV